MDLSKASFCYSGNIWVFLKLLSATSVDGYMEEVQEVTLLDCTF
jgi:hypothetical protein